METKQYRQANVDFYKIFGDIYAEDAWGNGSGWGSSPEYTRGYKRFLENFIRKNNIKTIVDFGCGDWQFSQYIDFSGCKYIGYDAAEEILNINKQKFEKENISFIKTPVDWNNIKSADLVICKDVLQHFSTAVINDFIRIVLPKFKFALITNCCTSDEKNLNKEIHTGDFRPLNLTIAPFYLNMKPCYIFPFYENSQKVTYLFNRDNVPVKTAKLKNMPVRALQKYLKWKFCYTPNRKIHKREYKIFKNIKDLL